MEGFHYVIPRPLNCLVHSNMSTSDRNTAMSSVSDLFHRLLKQAGYSHALWLTICYVTNAMSSPVARPWTQCSGFQYGCIYAHTFILLHYIYCTYITYAWACKAPLSGPRNQYFYLHNALYTAHYISQTAQSIFHMCTFLGLFTKLRNVIVSFVMCVCLSVCVSVRTEHLGSHCTYFDEIWYLSFFIRIYFGQIQFSLKSDKNDGCFTWRRFYVYDNILLNYS